MYICPCEGHGAYRGSKGTSPAILILHETEVTGDLDAPATLRSVKDPELPTGWAPEPFWVFL